jgi:hypothetical protein
VCFLGLAPERQTAGLEQRLDACLQPARTWMANASLLDRASATTQAVRPFLLNQPRAGATRNTGSRKDSVDCQSLWHALCGPQSLSTVCWLS